jgi:hypothetical protein
MQPIDEFIRRIAEAIVEERPPQDVVEELLACFGELSRRIGRAGGDEESIKQIADACTELFERLDRLKKS